MTQETVRYWGETELEREAAFRADAANRSARGWEVLQSLTEWPVGKSGLDLVVTYQLASGAVQPPVPPAHFGTASAPNQPAWSPSPPNQSPVWAPPSPRSITPRLDWIMGSGAAEPAPARYLRRLLVFGGLPTVFTMVKLTESRMPGGWTPPDLYPVLAFGVGLEGAITLGVTWYLLRWRRIPLVIRLVLVGIGVLFAACLFVAAFCYVIGQPLTSQ